MIFLQPLRGWDMGVHILSRRRNCGYYLMTPPGSNEFGVWSTLSVESRNS